MYSKQTPEFTTELFDYQKGPYKRFVELEHERDADPLKGPSSVLLALKYGQGKTAITLKRIVDSFQEAASKIPAEKEGVTLVVTPIIVINEWLEQSKKFAPGLKVCAITNDVTGKVSEACNLRWHNIKQQHMVLIPYSMLSVAYEKCSKHRRQILRTRLNTLQTKLATQTNTSISTIVELREKRKEEQEECRNLIKLLDRYSSDAHLDEALPENLRHAEILNGISEWYKCIYYNNWRRLVLDEAHECRNESTTVFLAASQVSTDAYVMCTGSPINNSVNDLVALFRLSKLCPLTDWNSSTEGAENYMFEVNRLRDKHMIRDNEFAIDDIYLTKHVIVRSKFTDPNEENYYNGVLDEWRSSGEDDRRGNTLKTINTLRQVCDGAICNDGETSWNVTKIDMMARYFSEVVVKRGDKALAFVWYCDAGRNLVEEIRKRNPSSSVLALYIDGSVNASTRKQLLNRLDSWKGPAVLVLTVLSMNAGFNAPNVNHVMRGYSWWNPTFEDQSSGRVKRPGQKKSVFVVDFFVEGTVDDSIWAVARCKLNMINSAMRGSLDEGHMKTITSRLAINNTIDSSQMPLESIVSSSSSSSSSSSEKKKKKKDDDSLTTEDLPRFLKTGVIMSAAVQGRTMPMLRLLCGFDMENSDAMRDTEGFHATEEESSHLCFVMKSCCDTFITPDQYSSVPATRQRETVFLNQVKKQDEMAPVFLFSASQKTISTKSSEVRAPMCGRNYLSSLRGEIHSGYSSGSLLTQQSADAKNRQYGMLSKRKQPLPPIPRSKQPSKKGERKMIMLDVNANANLPFSVNRKKKKCSYQNYQNRTSAMERPALASRGNSSYFERPYSQQRTRGGEFSTKPSASSVLSPNVLDTAMSAADLFSM